MKLENTYDMFQKNTALVLDNVGFLTGGEMFTFDAPFIAAQTKVSVNQKLK